MSFVEKFSNFSFSSFENCMLPGHDPNRKGLNCTDALLLKRKTIAKKKKS